MFLRGVYPELHEILLCARNGSGRSLGKPHIMVYNLRQEPLRILTLNCELKWGIQT